MKCRFDLVPTLLGLTVGRYSRIDEWGLLIKIGRITLTISDRIFERLRELSMTQQEFSNKTGIIPSTISEWKKNKTNPSSDKIMTICRALRVSPEWLLSGVDAAGSRRESDYYTIHKSSNMGKLITLYLKVKPQFQGRIIGYLEALSAEGEDL